MGKNSSSLFNSTCLLHRTFSNLIENSTFLCYTLYVSGSRIPQTINITSMLKRAIRDLIQPILDEGELHRFPRLLRTVYLLIVIAGGGITIVNLKVLPGTIIVILILLVLFSLTALLGIGSRIEFIIRLTLPVFMLVLLHWALTVTGGVHDPALVGYPIIIVFTALLYGRRSLPFIVFLSLISVFIITYREINSTSGTPFSIYADYLDFATISIFIVTSSYFLWEIIKSLEANILIARTSERRWRSLVENAPATVITTNSDGEITFINFPPCASLDDVAIGGSVLEIFDRSYHRLIRESINSTVTYKNQSVIELPVHCANDITKWYSIRIGVNNTEDLDEGLIFIFSETTDKVVAEARLAYQSTHDNLTGLPNRSLIRDLIDKALARCRRDNAKAAVIYIDIDDFIEINELHGHETGDLALKIIGSRIQDFVVSKDTVGRLDSDEFVLFVEDIGSADAVSDIVKNLIDKVAAPIKLSQGLVKTSCSVGISIFPQDGENAPALINAAERAMLFSKEKGDVHFQFHFAELSQEAISGIMTKQMLEEAVEKSSFQLHFQPLVNMGTMQVVGVEALVRLISPSGDLVYPDNFIGTAEQTGQIINIGKWVIKKACETQVKLKEEFNHDLVMSINLSAVEWQGENLITYVKETIELTGVSPESIEFEVTETSMLRNLELSLQHMKMLRDLGVRLTVDDFGTGYSSLSYLWQLPITGIKIDRSFTHRSEVNAQTRIITGGIIEIAKALGLYVIIEGLETQSSVEQFKKMGGNIGQGYYLSKPLELSSFEAYYKQNLQDVQSLDV